MLVSKWFSAALLLVLLGTGSVSAETASQLPQQSLSPLHQVITIKDILSPTRLRASTGETYILDNIRVPATYTPQAIAWLEGQTRDKKINLFSVLATGPAHDRWGNMRVHATSATAPHAWIQGEMITQGLAMADGVPDNPVLTRDLFVREDAARIKDKGLWSDPSLQPRHADALGGARDQFMIVTGRVQDIAKRKGVSYINFGQDWKTDFTLQLTKDNARAFPRGFDLDGLRGKTIRVRGWVSERNGPMIDLTYPEQIEILTESPAP